MTAKSVSKKTILAPPEKEDDLFASLTPMLRSLAMRGVLRSYAKKTILISEGDEGGSIYVLLKGSVKVFSMDSSGRELTYGIIREGDYFGEMSLDGGLRSASVMTLEPCSCAVLTRNDVSEHLAVEPQFALDLVVQVIHRARAATEVARNMALFDVYSRLIAVLQEGLEASDYAANDAAQNPGGGQPALLVSHVLECTHQDIASRIGASREAISRVLKDLERGGYLILSSKRITLLKKLPERV